MEDKMPCGNTDPLVSPANPSGNNAIEAPLHSSSPSIASVSTVPVVKAKKPRSEKQKASFEAARIARAEAVIRRKQAKEDAAVQSLVDRKGYVLPATKTSRPTAGVNSHNCTMLKPPQPQGNSIQSPLSDDCMEGGWEYPETVRSNFKIQFV